MPNYCSYDMKVCGSKEHCGEWFKKMSSYDEDNHFYRMVLSPIDVSEGGTNDKYYMIFSGFCAWSLDTCCRESGYSEGIDLFALNTKDLELSMEAWSKEPGMGFQEHYVYINGVCVHNALAKWEYHQWDEDNFESIEEYKKANPDYIEESGGFDHYGVFCI